MKILRIIAVSIILTMTCYAQEKKAEPVQTPPVVNLNEGQAREVAAIFKDAELAGERLRAAQLERENVQMRYALMVRRFMDELKLTADDYRFDEQKRVFVKAEAKK